MTKESYPARRAREQELSRNQMTAELERRSDAPAKTPAEVKRASTANTRRRLAKIQAEPDWYTVTQIAKELGLATSTIKKRVQQMPGAFKIGRAWVMSREQADALRENPPVARKRTK